MDGRAIVPELPRSTCWLLGETMVLVVRSQWTGERMALPETLRCCSTHATPANGASTCLGSLRGHYEQVADRITNEVNQRFWIDS